MLFLVVRWQGHFALFVVELAEINLRLEDYGLFVLCVLVTLFKLLLAH